MATANLLIELFVEELPPKNLKLLGSAFGAGLLARLSELGLVAGGSSIAPFATPRRLAVRIDAVAGRVWKPLSDTVNDPITASRAPEPWRNWQRTCLVNRGFRVRVPVPALKSIVTHGVSCS